MRELFQFLWQRKKFWLAPVIVALLIIGALLVLTARSALSSLIYTLF